MSKVTMKPDPSKDASQISKLEPEALIRAARAEARGTTEIQLFTDDEEAVIRQLDSPARVAATIEQSQA